jgi:hypothetical protein
MWFTRTQPKAKGLILFYLSEKIIKVTGVIRISDAI